MLGRQWEARLRLWNEALESRYVRPVSELQMEYFTTFDRIPFEDARNGSYSKMPAGLRWGEKYEYGWFRTSVALPDEVKDKRVVLSLSVSREMLVFVNGMEAGSIDKQHKLITLTRNAVPGTVYEIYAEAYAGHGATIEDVGPVSPEEITVPENPGIQVTVGRNIIGVFEEDIFQTHMDYLCLYELMKSLPETSLRRMKITEGLKQFTYIADFELPYEDMLRSVTEARKILKPLLECKNGSTAPEFTVFGQSHIDLAWLWPEEETKRKSARTYSNQLALMDEYPEFRFLLCAPTVLEYAKELYPNLYEKIKAAVDEGKFYPEGAMWVECDTHIPSGESLIRQFVKGRLWYKNEMNSDSVMAWMPDTFGFSGNLPQIMRKCGIKYFATQKLLRQDPECEPFPYNIFMWEGIDGTRVLSHLFKKNNSQLTPAHLIERWEKDRIQEENIDSMLFPFGFGDGGGGCTRTMLEQARRCKDLEGAPRCTMESPVKFFERCEAKAVDNVYAGEIYLAWHRGTLTSQAETKKGIRKAEIALHNLEFLMAKVLIEADFNIDKLPDEYRECRNKLEQIRNDVLFCQFHDIAPGTSIERVHREAEARLKNAENEAITLMKTLSGAVYPEGKVMSYNMTGLPKNCKGKVIPAYSSHEVKDEAISGKQQVIWEECDGGYKVTNNVFTCVINENGEITSFKRNGSNKEYVYGAWNRFLMFRDVNTCYDAWEIGSMYENVPVELDEKAELGIESSDDGVTVVVRKMLHDSPLIQRIFIGTDSERIDFMTEIDRNERHKMIKVSFDSEVFANEAYHDIQFGYVKRPTHRSRQADRDRYEVSQQKYTCVTDGAYGVAVLNDCKYGVNVKQADIRLTLTRAALAPDMHADRGKHRFTYSVYAFEGDMAKSKLLEEAYDLNNPVSELPGKDGGSLFSTDTGSCVIESVFPTDDDKAVVLRVYEAMGRETECSLKLTGKISCAEETDMMIMHGQKLDINEGSISLKFNPFEIKTIVVRQ